MHEVVTVKAEDLVSVSCPLCGSPNSRYERTLNGYVLERCLSCDMVFNNPRCSDEALARVYEEREDPDECMTLYEWLHTPSVKAIYDEALDFLETLLPARGRILDFGSGPGYFVERAQQRGWDGHGVDMGEWCRIAAERRGVPNVHIGRLEDMGFPDEHFDAIYAKAVLEHLPRPQQQLRQMYNLLRPNGVLFVAVPNYNCLSILLRRDDFVLNTPPQHVNYFTPKTLRRLLEQCDFAQVQTGSYGGLKWENILGRPYRGDIVESYEMIAEHRKSRRADTGDMPKQRPKSESARGASFFSRAKRLARPVVKKVLYDWAKVGLALSAVCRRPSGNQT